MSFQLVDLKSSQTLWCNITGTSELFAGQIVMWSDSADATGEGVQAPGIADGAYDADDDSCLAGLVLTTSNDINNKVFEDGTTVAGFAGEEITGVTTQANQVARQNFITSGGMYSKGERQALVQIALIDATTRLKGRFYNAAYGTAPTLLTETTGNAAGTTVTTNTNDATGVAEFSTIYCRSGANAGLYRVCDDTSATAHTCDIAFPQDIAIGDTFIKVMAKQGLSRVQTDANNLYFDVSAAVTADYWGIIIESLDLRVAGEESCIFRFLPKHFDIGTA